MTTPMNLNPDYFVTTLDVPRDKPTMDSGT